MSEEEKKAIENVKRMFEDITIEELLKDKNFNITIYSLGILDILRVIAIVDKQQKEIEEKTTILLAGAEKVKQLEKEIEKLKQEMEERLIGREEITKYEMGYEIENNYISKDKIKEKIKELEEIGQMLTAEQGYWGSPKLLNQMEILKELLGE